MPVDLDRQKEGQVMATKAKRSGGGRSTGRSASKRVSSTRRKADPCKQCEQQARAAEQKLRRALKARERRQLKRVAAKPHLLQSSFGGGGFQSSKGSYGGFGGGRGGSGAMGSFRGLNGFGQDPRGRSSRSSASRDSRGRSRSGSSRSGSSSMMLMDSRASRGGSRGGSRSSGRGSSRGYDFDLDFGRFGGGGGGGGGKARRSSRDARSRDWIGAPIRHARAAVLGHKNRGNKPSRKFQGIRPPLFVTAKSEREQGRRLGTYWNPAWVNQPSNRKSNVGRDFYPARSAPRKRSATLDHVRSAPRKRSASLDARSYGLDARSFGGGRGGSSRGRSSASSARFGYDSPSRSASSRSSRGGSSASSRFGSGGGRFGGGLDFDFDLDHGFDLDKRGRGRGRSRRRSSSRAFRSGGSGGFHSGGFGGGYGGGGFGGGSRGRGGARRDPSFW